MKSYPPKIKKALKDLTCYSIEEMEKEFKKNPEILKQIQKTKKKECKR
jgi:hypothetical protein